MGFQEGFTKNSIIEIFGLGYVGLPLAVRLALSGFKVIGIDKDENKIKRLEAGNLVDSEKFLQNDFDISKKNGNLVVSNTSQSSENTKIGIVCVPTPIPQQGVLSDKFVRQASNSFLNTAKKNDVIILESSIEIGTTEKIHELIESNGFKIGQDFGLAFCPERIDPKNKKWNLENIPRIIYCSDDNTFEICKKIYKNINNANLKRVSSAKIAEVVKSFENAFRLVNISLVNELAVLCDKLNIDVKEIIDAAATKPFGFMPFYPSAGAGGHCIPKDPRFLLESAKKFNMQFSILENSLMINQFIPKYISNTIEDVILENSLERSVLVCGLSYKPDIEDMRDSPGFKIIHELQKKDMQVSGFDPYYKKELGSKYIIENHMEQKFDIIQDLSYVEGFGCICIVQHHAKSRFELQEIYKNSTVPFIYDCQNRLECIEESKTILRRLGS